MPQTYGAQIQLEAEDTPLALQCKEALRVCGLNVTTEAADVLAVILGKLPNPSDAAEIAKRFSCATRSAPVIALIPLAITPETRDRDTPDHSLDQDAASLAYLRAHGVIILRSPDVWLECVVLVAMHGAPKGSLGAIVAKPGGWLAATAAALQKRAESAGERFSPVGDISSGITTDFVLTDMPQGPKQGPLVIPVGVRRQSTDAPCVVGLANALAAAEACGQASLRIAAGDGPATPGDLAPGIVEQERLDRQLAKLGDRVGDHECKVLLSCYSVSITRQAVATTPSAATRIAKKAGYPVQLKAWGHDQPSEANGAALQVELATAADVRRAFSAVCAEDGGDAVIVRETPMQGRELHIEIRTMGDIGLVCFLYQRGQPEPHAALAPLRTVDAESMAHHVLASRSSDRGPDWGALATLLVRASHMVASEPRILSIELSRVIVGHQGEGAVVVDARARLR